MRSFAVGKGPAPAHGEELLGQSVPAVEIMMGLSEPSSVCSGRVAAAHGAVEPSLDAAETVKDRRFHCFCFPTLPPFTRVGGIALWHLGC